VILPADAEIPGLKDSKLLTRAQREQVAQRVLEQATAVSIVRVRPTSIDRRGLHRSNLWALRQAAMRLQPQPDYLLVDGYPITRAPFPSLSIKCGDKISRAVAAASVVAKVTRDRAMRRLHRSFPEYNFRGNKGYGTAEHWYALRVHGPSPVHRLTFNGVGQMSLWAPSIEVGLA
jgi:ribonuclease HII